MRLDRLAAKQGPVALSCRSVNLSIAEFYISSARTLLIVAPALLSLSSSF